MKKQFIVRFTFDDVIEYSVKAHDEEDAKYEAWEQMKRKLHKLISIKHEEACEVKNEE